MDICNDPRGFCSRSEDPLGGRDAGKAGRVLLRRVEPLRPGTRGKAVVGDEVAIEEVPTDQSGDGISHLDGSV